MKIFLRVCSTGGVLYTVNVMPEAASHFIKQVFNPSVTIPGRLGTVWTGSTTTGFRAK